MAKIQNQVDEKPTIRPRDPVFVNECIGDLALAEGRHLAPDRIVFACGYTVRVPRLRMQESF
jgi:hypothetical protein